MKLAPTIAFLKNWNLSCPFHSSKIIYFKIVINVALNKIQLYLITKLTS